MSIELIHKKEVLRRYSKNLQLFKAFLRGACVKTNNIDHSLKFNKREATLYKGQTLQFVTENLRQISHELKKLAKDFFVTLICPTKDILTVSKENF